MENTTHQLPKQISLATSCVSAVSGLFWREITRSAAAESADSKPISLVLAD